MKSGKLRLFLYAGLSLAVMCLIFYLSSQPASVSQKLSDGILYRIMIFLGFRDEETIMSFGKLIRKIAHFGEYGVLAFCLGLYFFELAGRNWSEVTNAFVRAFLVSGIYAVSDELHQYFVPGRSMQFSDVLLDCFGAFAGLCCLYILNIVIIRHREERKNFE